MQLKFYLPSYVSKGEDPLKIPISPIRRAKHSSKKKKTFPIIFKLTYARRDMTPGLLVSLSTSVARRACNSILARTLPARLVARLPTRAHRVAVAGWT